jgi:DNA primase
MNCKKAKLIDLVSYLKKQGFSAKKTTQKETWFCSPFRDEKTPSFKIDNAKNIFYDFGEGIGGTIIDFIMKYNNCSIKKALEILSEDSFPFHQQTKHIKNKPTYSIKKVTELTNQKLLNYLNTRKINLQFAKQFCFQVHYSFDNKNENYGIGFMNNSGGLEIRNKNFKGCLGKKEITTINNNSEVVSMFESWSDFLSYLTLKNEVPKENFIVLNSTSMIKKAIELVANYNSIKLFFDNDDAGNTATDFLIKNIENRVVDNRIHYKSYNDLNEFLISRM